MATRAHDITDPMSALTTVPALKAAWNRGMTLRPRRRSTDAASRFIATSQTLTPIPRRSSPAATTRRECQRSMPRLRVSDPVAATIIPPRMVRTTPNRWAMRPADGRASSDPRAAAKSVPPSSPGVRWSCALASAIRDAQAANSMPASAKTAKTPLRAARTAARDGASTDMGIFDHPAHV